MLSLGNSEGTKGKDLTGDIILVKTIEEFNALPESAVKGKIVFFNNPLINLILLHSLDIVMAEYTGEQQLRWLPRKEEKL